MRPWRVALQQSSALTRKPPVGSHPWRWLGKGWAMSGGDVDGQEKGGGWGWLLLNMRDSYPIILHTYSHYYKFLLAECRFLIFLREIQIFSPRCCINFLFGTVGLIEIPETGDPVVQQAVLDWFENRRVQPAWEVYVHGITWHSGGFATDLGRWDSFEDDAKHELQRYLNSQGSALSFLVWQWSQKLSAPRGYPSDKKWVERKAMRGTIPGESNFLFTVCLPPLFILLENGKNMCVIFSWWFTSVTSGSWWFITENGDMYCENIRIRVINYI